MSFVHAASAPALPSALVTGHARIDDDHDALLALCGAVVAADDAALADAFAALQARFAGHFAVEDELMAAHDFASRQCHLDEHAAVLRSFEEVGAAMHAGDASAARRMAAALADWLPEHIDALDRHLAKFLFHRRTGGAPVLLHR